MKRYGKLSLHHRGGNVCWSRSQYGEKENKKPSNRMHDNSILHLKLIRLKHQHKRMEKKEKTILWVLKPRAARHNCLKLSFRTVQIFIEKAFFSFWKWSLTVMCLQLFCIGHWFIRNMAFQSLTKFLSVRWRHIHAHISLFSGMTNKDIRFWVIVN